MRPKPLAILIAATSLLALPSIAQAAFTYEGSFGEGGTGGGQFSRPAGISINSTTGDVYVTDRNQNRIEQFDEDGEFIRAWGFDVVASGEHDQVPANEVQKIVIKADSGTFTLSYEGSATTPLPFDATPGEVQTALNALGTVNAGGGSVSVTGGPGDAAGTNPYVVVFSGGSLAGVDKPQIAINPSGLGMPAGTQLSCQGEPFLVSFFSPTPPEEFEYQWLANGTPIPGSTATATPGVSVTYAPAPADAGKALQCQVAAKYGSIKTVQADRAYHVPSPVAALPNPPLGPLNGFGTPQVPAPTPDGPLALGSPGGQILTCNAGTWANSPAEYTYAFYRNGTPIGTPTTTAATSSTYTTTAADVSSRSIFQCSVTGINAAGASTLFSAMTETSPGLVAPKPNLAESTVTASVASRTYTATNGGSSFEVCAANPPSSDVCKAGVEGGGLGQFAKPRGIAVDNSAAGAGEIYVLDDQNFRVQKFSATGTPILIYGKEVNLSTGGDLCTVASGDDCGPGLINETLATGGFSGWDEQRTINSELGNELAVDGEGNVYVGDGRNGFHDKNKGRIQKFSPTGTYLAQVRIPTNAVNSGFFPRPLGIGVNLAGQVFAAVTAQSSVERFEQAEFGFGDTGPEYPERFTFHENEDPSQLAISPVDEKIWITDWNYLGRHICEESGTDRRALLAYDAEGHRLFCSAPSGEAELPTANGLAISPSGKAYVSVGSENKVKIFKLPESEAPMVTSQAANSITTESARLGAQVNPGFDSTSFKFEFGDADCSSNPCMVYPGDELVNGVEDKAVEVPVKDLKPNTKYHFRVIVKNAFGEDVGADHTFTTFPFVDLLNDKCPNALVRKQTKTAGVDDCRAYELASDEFTGGYDVVSDLVAGEEPLPAYPQATGKLLYGVKDGGIPGTGNPTNRGIDPYVAVRGAEGWHTVYVGIPADNPFATAPFSSTLAEADAGLDTFAFAGPGICSPCFADGSNGIPLQMPDGTLVQGMKGTNPQPAAKPTGYVAKTLSADGSHLLFGSSVPFESTGNEGSVSIYARDLQKGTTEVVSTLPSGATMTGEIAELDVSTNGSRVLIGTKVSTDAAANTLYRLYLHLGTSPNSVELAEATTTGVLFAGMTTDGSKVFFTTKDKLLPAEDTDESADLYRADVDGQGAVDLTLLSTGTPLPVGNLDSCDPAPNAEGNNWNAVGAASANDCGVLAIAGGGGLATEEGTIYFLSPEKLDGQGTLNQPNLFVAAPGTSPKYVTTLEPDNPLLRHAATDSEIHRYADFQVTPDGAYAAFATTLPLNPNYNNAAHAEVYRYQASSGAIACVSCNPTEGIAVSEAALPAHGLGLLEDGRTFFNTGDQLVLRDTNERRDAYEWQKGAPQLISTGNSLYDSGLHSVSSDGKDALFFTRERLVPADLNGETMKVYDAREGGGYFVIPQAPPCAASDECHGPGSVASPPPPIGSYKGKGGQFNELVCKKNQIKRNGKCVKKPKKPKKPKHKKHSKRGGRR